MKLSERLTEKNWIQVGISEHPGDCLTLALAGVVPHGEEVVQQASLLEQVVRELFPERSLSSGLQTIYRFNDHPETTWSDVEKVIGEFERRLYD